MVVVYLRQHGIKVHGHETRTTSSGSSLHKFEKLGFRETHIAANKGRLLQKPPRI